MSNNTTTTATINLALINSDALSLISRGRQAACALAVAENDDTAARKAVKTANDTVERLTAAGASDDELTAARANLAAAEKTATAAADTLKVCRELVVNTANDLIDYGIITSGGIFAEHDTKAFDLVTMLDRFGVVVGNADTINRKSYDKVVAPLTRFFGRQYDYIKRGKVCVSTRVFKTTPKEWLVGLSDMLLNAGSKDNPTFITTDNYGIVINPKVAAKIAVK